MMIGKCPAACCLHGRVDARRVCKLHVPEALAKARNFVADDAHIVNAPKARKGLTYHLLICPLCTCVHVSACAHLRACTRACARITACQCTIHPVSVNSSTTLPHSPQPSRTPETSNQQLPTCRTLYGSPPMKIERCATNDAPDATSHRSTRHASICGSEPLALAPFFEFQEMEKL